MRKNFLLLFLMALLPLAGWAAAPTISLSKTQYTYIGGSMETAVRAKLTITGYYDDVRFYAALEGPSAPEASTLGVTPINAGGYYVRAANGVEWSDPVYFRIMPKDLELTATQVEVGYGNYSVIAGGADIPSGYYTVSGFVGSDDIYDVNITGVKGSSAAADAANGAAGSYPYNLSIANASSGNPNYSLKVIGTGSTLTINKAPLTITTEDKAKVYGNGDPEFTATYVGFVNGEDASVLTDLEITRVAGEDVGTYAISVTATSSNYEITPVNSGLLTISQRSIDATNLAITGVDPNGYTYTGQPIQPTFVVKDMSLGEEGTALVAGTDYTVTWYQNTNAGTGETDESPRFKIKPVTTSNFTFSNTNKYFTINKAPLTLSTVAKEKTYGTADPTFEVAGTGFVNNETVAVLTSLTFERETGEDVGTYVISVATVNAANYEITLDTQNNGSLTINKATLNAQVTNQNITFGADVPDNAIQYVNGIKGTDVFADVVDLTNVTYTYKQGDNVVENPVNAGTYDITATGATADNYNVIIANGTLIISPVTVYIKPVAQSKFYGQADPNFAQATTAMYELVDGEGNAVDGAVLNGTVALGRKAGENVGNYDIYVKSYTANPEVADNYSPSNTYYTNDENLGSHTATFTIKAQEAKLILKFKEGTPATKVYGEDTYAYSVNDLEVVSGLAGSDTWETLKSLATFTPTLESENVHFDGNKVTATITGLANYPNIEVQPLAFTVTKRKFGVKPSAQTKDYGAAISTGKTYWARAAASTYAPGEGKDNVLVELYTDEDVATFAPGSVHEGVIKARIADESNYELDLENSAWGTLTVNAATQITLDRDDIDLATSITAFDGQNVVVKFDNMTMKHKEWYAIVLPFATTPAELVKALGEYAVFNVLDTENSTDQNFRFKLEMDELPAGVPFLIKPARDLNWADFDLGTISSAPVKKTIKKDITPVTAQYQSKDLVTFTGTYANDEILGVPGKPSAETANILGECWWLSDTDYAASTVANDWRKPKNNAHALKAMEAYLIAGEGWTTYTPNFTVEDFDGQTTSIKTLGAETIHNMLTEGWYTLNGVKLQSAPTQKGVYINNGKKVVIR